VAVAISWGGEVVPRDGVRFSRRIKPLSVAVGQKPFHRIPWLFGSTVPLPGGRLTPCGARTRPDRRPTRRLYSSGTRRVSGHPPVRASSTACSISRASRGARSDGAPAGHRRRR
jgi:hypothetical protein